MEKTRINKRDDIDVQRVILWYSYLRHHLVAKNPSQIARIIEPHKIRVVEGYIIDNDKKWRNYKKGLNVPNPKLIDQAESVVQGSSLIINHVLWQAMKSSTGIELLQECIKKLSWEVQRILYQSNKYSGCNKLVPNLSKRKLKQLEHLAGLDALAAQIIFLRISIIKNENVLDICRSIYRTLLIICIEIPFFYYRESLIALMNRNIFSLVDSRNSILDKGFEYNFSENVKKLLELFLAMEDRVLVGITRKQRIKALSDLLHNIKILDFFEEFNFLTEGIIVKISNANYLNLATFEIFDKDS